MCTLCKEASSWEGSKYLYCCHKQRWQVQGFHDTENAYLSFCAVERIILLLILENIMVMCYQIL